MLAHFQHFDFAALLEDFDLLHILFIYSFDRNLLAILLVGR